MFGRQTMGAIRPRMEPLNLSSATSAGHTEAFLMTGSARFAGTGVIVIAVVIIWAHLAVALFSIF